MAKAGGAMSDGPQTRITGCPLLHHPGNAVVGISRSQSSDEVLVTVQSAGLMLQTLSEQVTTASITSPSSRRFQCPAVQHPACESVDTEPLPASPLSRHLAPLKAANCPHKQAGNGKVYAALSSPPEIRMWDGMQHAFSDGSLVLLPEGTEVHSLHTATTIDGVIVVYSDGSCDHLASDGFTPPDDHRAASPVRGKRKRRRKDQASVIWAEVLIEQKTSTTRLLQIDRTGAPGSDQVRVSSRVVSQDPETSLQTHTRLLENPGCGCLAACFQWPSSLFTLWEDGTLWESDVGKGGAGLHDESGPVAGVQNAAFRGFEAGDEGDRSGVAVMVACTTSHLAVLANTGEPVQLRGFLWDTTFSTLQADADVGKFTGVQWSPKHTVTGAIGKGAGCAIFSSSGTVVALNFPEGAAAGTLAAAVNKLEPSRRVVTDEWIDRSAAAVTTAHPLWDARRKKTASVDAELIASRKELLRAVLDTSMCASSQALDRSITAFINTFTDSAGDVTDGGLQHHVITIFRRCVEEKRFFAGKAIERLLKMKCLSYHHCSEVLSVAVSGKHRSLLRACLISLDGISETALLWCFGELFARNGPSPPCAREDDSETELQEFLRLAYARRWNEEELINALQPIALDGIIFLVQNLRWWLSQQNELPAAGHAGGSARAEIPSQGDILDWTAAVIDAKFATLVHSIESHELIREINGLLEQQRELCEQLMSVSGLLGRLNEGKALPRSHAEIGPYSIELLNL